MNNNILAEDVRSFVLARLVDPLSAKGLAPQDVRDDFDLLSEGVIDSLGIVELISAVLDEFRIEVDFEALNPEELTIVGSLCDYIAQKSATSATRSRAYSELEISNSNWKL